MCLVLDMLSAEKSLKNKQIIFYLQRPAEKKKWKIGKALGFT